MITTTFFCTDASYNRIASSISTNPSTLFKGRLKKENPLVDILKSIYIHQPFTLFKTRLKKENPLVAVTHMLKSR
jgi:hypothetical protein